MIIKIFFYRNKKSQKLAVVHKFIKNGEPENGSKQRS